jgi:hypothetical protein
LSDYPALQVSDFSENGVDVGFPPSEICPIPVFVNVFCHFLMIDFAAKISNIRRINAVNKEVFLRKSNLPESGLAICDDAYAESFICHAFARGADLQ